MLTAADDYPLHQTPEPLAFAGSDRNFYDRFFFNGYSADGSVFFAAALGLYPQLNIMDAAFCLSVGETQYNLRASKEMQGDRLDLSVGPIAVEIVRPLQETRLVIGDNEHGITGTLTAVARHRAIEEPRFMRRQGTRLFMDYTRATQNISWSGEIMLKGERIEINGFLGTRDRSWGLRPVGDKDTQAIVPPAPQQFYWLWTPINFESHCVFFHTNDDGAGEAWNRRAVIDDLSAGTRLEVEKPKMEHGYAEASRRMNKLSVDLAAANLSFAADQRVFYMQGLGYTHPEWSHGCHHGALRVACDTIDLTQAEAELAAGKIENLHIQKLSTVQLTTDSGSHQGQGVIEQLFIGPHAPSGFHDLFDRIIG